MSKSWLKSRARNGIITGMVLLLLGFVTFVFGDTGDKIEKIGIFLMSFGGVLLGMGYTAHIAWKDR